MPAPAFPGIRLAIFDMDGTLVDAFADIGAAVDHALRAMGRPPLDLPTVKSYVGTGGRNLMARCLGSGASEPEIDRAFAFWRTYYAEHPCDHAVVYPGVADGLAALRRRGMRLAVLSNKWHDLTVAILGNLGLAPLIDRVQGEIPGMPRKPDPAGVRAILEGLAIDPRAACIVGDGEADMGVARNAGIPAIGVDWGVNSAARLRDWGAAAVVSDFSALLDCLP